MCNKRIVALYLKVLHGQVENGNQLFFILLLVTTFYIVSTCKPMISGSMSPFLHSSLRELPFFEGDRLDNLWLYIHHYSSWMHMIC